MFNIDLNSDDPIYLQIVNQTKDAIVLGLLKDGDKMPSIREMSRTILVNQSTVTRAYRELEDLGIIKTMTGIGAFISLDSRKIKWEKENMEEKLKSVFRESIFYGFTLDEIISIYKDVKKEGEK